MTEKMLTFPSPTSPDPGDGVNRPNFNFPRTESTQTNKDICTGTTCADPGFFVRGVQAPQLILQFTEGVQWFYYTFSMGSNFFPGGGGPNANFYRDPYNYTL